MSSVAPHVCDRSLCGPRRPPCWGALPGALALRPTSDLDIHLVQAQEPELSVLEPLPRGGILRCGRGGSTDTCKGSPASPHHLPAPPRPPPPPVSEWRQKSLWQFAFGCPPGWQGLLGAPGDTPVLAASLCRASFSGCTRPADAPGPGGCGGPAPLHRALRSRDPASASGFEKSARNPQHSVFTVCI